MYVVLRPIYPGEEPQHPLRRMRVGLKGGLHAVEKRHVYVSAGSLTSMARQSSPYSSYYTD
jgi:hypothetical protein